MVPKKHLMSVFIALLSLQKEVLKAYDVPNEEMRGQTGPANSARMFSFQEALKHGSEGNETKIEAVDGIFRVIEYNTI